MGCHVQTCVFETIQLRYALRNSQLLIFTHLVPSGRAQPKGNRTAYRYQFIKLLTQNWLKGVPKLRENTTTVGSGSFQPNWNIRSWIWIIPLKTSEKYSRNSHFAPPPHLMSLGILVPSSNKNKHNLGKSILPDILNAPPKLQPPKQKLWTIEWLAKGWRLNLLPPKQQSLEILRKFRKLSKVTDQKNWAFSTVSYHNWTAQYIQKTQWTFLTLLLSNCVWCIIMNYPGWRWLNYNHSPNWICGVIPLPSYLSFLVRLGCPWYPFQLDLMIYEVPNLETKHMCLFFVLTSQHTNISLETKQQINT